MKRNNKLSTAGVAGGLIVVVLYMMIPWKTVWNTIVSSGVNEVLHGTSTATTTTSTAGTTTLSDPVAPVYPKPETFVLALGQSRTVGGVMVTPQRVIEDSRCSPGVQCIWAGRVVLEIGVKEFDGKVIKKQYTVNLEEGTMFSTETVKFTLNLVTPTPPVSVQQQGLYRFTITGEVHAPWVLK